MALSILSNIFSEIITIGRGLYFYDRNSENVRVVLDLLLSIKYQQAYKAEERENEVVNYFQGKYYERIRNFGSNNWKGQIYSSWDLCKFWKNHECSLKHIDCYRKI